MFKIYLLDPVNYPTEIYNDLNVFNPVVLEPELEMNGDNGILIGKLTFKLHDSSIAPQLRLLQNTVIVTQLIAGVETVIFRGRPLLRDDDDYNDQDFTFEGILAGLNDTLQTPSNKETGGRLYEHFVTIVDWHNHQVQSISNNRQLDYSKINRTDPKSHMYTISAHDAIHIFIEKMVKYTRFRASTMDHIKTQYVDAHGGYFYLENEPLTYDSNGCVVLHNYLKYVDIYNPDQTHVNRQRIEFGKNLISIKRSASADDFATVLVPLGKQLTDIEKSWPYYQSVENNKVRKIVSSPDEAVLENYNTTGAYINSETGRVTTGVGSAYVILNDIEVNEGDVFYLTTYLEGFSTDISAAAYAILSVDGTRVFTIGSSVRNSKDSGGTVTTKTLALKDERIEIPTLEEYGVDLKLRTAYMISANDPNGGFVLKKFNKNYQEDNVTIMSANPVATGTVRKTGQYAFGRDVYPDATDTPTAPETYEASKRLVHHDLFSVFGSIEKSMEFSDYAIEDVNDMVGVASKELEKMGEDLEIEIQAADLSYIDESQEPFQPYDLVPVYSEPHGIDMMLPIVKMTLPLADPAAATYTLQNDIHLSEDSKKYISQMVSSPGAGTQKNQTVIIYNGGGGSGGGGGEVPVRELPDVTAADNGKVLGVVNGQWGIKEDETGGGSDIDPFDIYRTAFTTKSGSTQRNITNGNNVQITGQVLADLLDENHGGCKLLEIDTSNNTEAAYEVDQVTSTNISFYRIADGKRHVITVPLNSNQGTYSVSDVIDIPEQEDELPTVTAQDNGKVLGVVNGEWAVKDDDTGDALPVVTTNDNGKVLGVVNGEWTVKKDDNVIPILYTPQEHSFSVRELNGTATGTALVTNYFTTTMADIRLMFVYDWGANIYQLYSVNRTTNEVKFRRRVGNVDTFLTITGDSPVVVESTETIAGNVDESGILLTLDSNRRAMNGDSTITGEEIRALVNSGKTVSLWDATHNRMFQYIGVGPSTRPTFVSVWGDTQYKIAVYANSSSTDETTSSLPLLPVPTHSDVGKALVVAESNNEQFYVLQTLPNITNALIYDTQDLTDQQLFQSHQNLHLYGSAVGFVYNGSTINAIGKSTGAHTAKMIVDDYFGDNTTLIDKAFLYVIDQNGNVYDLDSVDTTNNIVVFKRRSGNTDYFLTLTGTSTAVVESTSTIGGSNTPFLISLSYNSSTNTWTCNKTAAEILANMANSMVYYQGYRYYVTSMFNTGGSSATIYYERQEIGSPDGIEEFKFEIQNDAVTIYRYTSPLNLFEIPIVYVTPANGDPYWDIDGTKIIAGAIYNYYKNCVLVTNGKRIHIVKSFRSEDPQDKYVELIGVEPASNGSDLTIWKLIAEANSSQHASITTYTFSGGSFGGNVFYYVDGTNIKGAADNIVKTGRQIYDETIAIGLSPVIYEYDDVPVYADMQYHFYQFDSGGLVFRRLDGKADIRIAATSTTLVKTINGYNTPYNIDTSWNSSEQKYYIRRYDASGNYHNVGYKELDYYAEGLMLNESLPVSKIVRSYNWIGLYFHDIQISSNAVTIVDWYIDAGTTNGVVVTRTVKRFQLTEYYTVTLNANGTVNTRDSNLKWSDVSARMSYPNCADYLLITWGSTLFTAKAVEKAANGDIKFICDVEHDGIQRHMVFTLDGDNILTTTAIETYSLRPVTVWEVADVSQGLLALNTNISSSLAWQLTGLDLTPFKRIKIYSKAGRKTGALAADSSITPASIIEMSLDDRAKETVSQNVFIGSSVVQNPNDPNRLGILTCAVSADKTKFAVVRATTLYGTAATSNTDAYPYVFMIEGYYD